LSGGADFQVLMKFKAVDQREAVISAAMDAIVLLDSNERIVMFNPAAELMFGVPATAVFGQTLDQFLPERLKEAQVNGRSALHDNGFSHAGVESQPREMRGVRSNSEEFPAEASVSQIQVAGESFSVIILRDITRRKQAEAALVRSQQEEHSRRMELETLMEAAPAMVWISHDPECNYVTSNRAGHEMMRMHGIENVSRRGGREKLHQHYKAYQNGKPLGEDDSPMRIVGRTGKALMDQELEIRFSDGTVCWFYGNVVPLLNLDGTVRGMVGIYFDITGHHQAEEALRQSELRLRFATDATGLGVFDYEPQTGRLIWSDLAKLHFGLPPEAEVTYETFLKGLHPEDRERMAAVVSDVLRTENGGHYAAEYRTVGLQDGRLRWLAAWGRVFFDSNGQATRFLGQTLDITQRKNQDDELRFSREALRALAARLQAVREEERARAAREIHDVLAQELTLLKLEVASLARRQTNPVEPKAQELVREKLASMTTLVDNAISSVQKIATELRPPVLDSLGLRAAVEWQVKDFQARTGITCMTQLPDNEIEADQERSTAVFRVLQESLTNVVRHAQATQVDVRLECSSTELMLTVQDNGRGFEPNTVDSLNSLGLLGMRERARLLGGTCLITSRPGTGTRVEARVRLSGPDVACGPDI
jgi:PAS domain S-box-containing protein